MGPLLVPIGVCVLAVLVLLADIAPAEGNARGTGALTALGLAGLFGLTFVAPLGDAFDGAWRTDAFTLYAERLVLAAGFLGAVASIDHADRVFPRRQGEYYLLLLSSLFGMTLLAGARELILLIVSFELMSIPQYVLAAIHKDGKRGAEGAAKLYLTGSISAALTVYGASFLVGAVGSTKLAAIASATPSPMLVLGGLLVLAGFAYKLGAVPFHFWIPDTYEAAPTPFVAFLSVAPKVATLSALVRFAGGLHAGFAGPWMPLLLVLTALTLVLGNVLAIPQSKVRRLLAYSGIGHAGLLLLAYALGSAEGIGAALFYLATYVVSNMGAFFVTEAVASRVGEDIVDWNGLGRRAPGLALAMLLCLLSLGGIPFVAGFWGKVFLFRAAWNAGQTWFVIVGALLSVVGLFYYMRVARAMYVEPPKAATPIVVGRATLAAIVFALIGVVGMGVAPSVFWTSAVKGGQAVVGGAVAAAER